MGKKVRKKATRKVPRKKKRGSIEELYQSLIEVEASLERTAQEVESLLGDLEALLEFEE